MTSPSCYRCWTRFRPWRAPSAGSDTGQTHSSPTAATITTSTAACCDSAGSGRSSPKRGVEHGSALVTFRYAVERMIAWLHGFRRLRIRWIRRDDIHDALLGLATCLITHRHLQRLC